MTTDISGTLRICPGCGSEVLSGRTFCRPSCRARAEHANAERGPRLPLTDRKAPGGQPYQKRSKPTRSIQEQVDVFPSLADLGIDRKTSMVAQQLADLPPSMREAIAQKETTLANCRQSEKASAARSGASEQSSTWARPSYRRSTLEAAARRSFAGGLRSPGTCGS